MIDPVRVAVSPEPSTPFGSVTAIEMRSTPPHPNPLKDSVGQPDGIEVAQRDLGPFAASSRSPWRQLTAALSSALAMIWQDSEETPLYENVRLGQFPPAHPTI